MKRPRASVRRQPTLIYPAIVLWVLLTIRCDGSSQKVESQRDRKSKMQGRKLGKGRSKSDGRYYVYYDPNQYHGNIFARDDHDERGKGSIWGSSKSGKGYYKHYTPAPTQSANPSSQPSVHPSSAPTISMHPTIDCDSWSSKSGKGKGKGRSRDYECGSRSSKSSKSRGKGRNGSISMKEQPSAVPSTISNSPSAVVGDLTAAPTTMPTPIPTVQPTLSPTAAPTATPTATPTSTPTATPTRTPTATPTSTPTVTPTAAPVAPPTGMPTSSPVAETETPTVAPVEMTDTPTTEPVDLTETPTTMPVTQTDSPTIAPATTTEMPTGAPVLQTNAPTAAPVVDTNIPTMSPELETDPPTAAPGQTEAPTPPTETDSPVVAPTGAPTRAPNEFRVDLSPWALTYETTSNLDPQQQDFEAAERITLMYLEEFFRSTFEFVPDTDFEGLSGSATGVALFPSRIGYETSVQFAESSQFVPTEAEMEQLLAIAFEEPNSQALYMMLSTLSDTNPFSTTTNVIFATSDNGQTARISPLDAGTVSIIAGICVLSVILMVLLLRRGPPSRHRPPRTTNFTKIPQDPYLQAFFEDDDMTSPPSSDARTRSEDGALLKSYSVRHETRITPYDPLLTRVQTNQDGKIEW